MKINKKKLLGRSLGGFSMAVPMIYILLSSSIFKLSTAIILGILCQTTFLISIELLLGELDRENKILKERLNV